MEMFKFGTKNALFGCFWAGILKTIVIFEISTLKFVISESLTHTVNFATGSAFSKGSGSTFSEGLGPGPLYKVCPVLPLLKSLVLILQAKNTNIHCIHDLMVDNLKIFFGCFVKYESITNLTTSQLKSFDLESNVRRMKSFYVGQKNHELIKKMLSLKKRTCLMIF